MIAGHHNDTEIIKIAYADDHAIVRRGICEFINTFRRCAVILEANNGRELLSLLEKAEEMPDICILDIFMPVLNGLETLIEIHKRWEDMKVLVLTGHSTDYYMIQMVSAGANGYLQKNCSPKELEAALHSIYENGIYNSDILTYQFYRSVKNKKVKLPTFTGNEIKLLTYCCSDLSYEQIADKMSTTARSVDWVRLSLFKKLNVGSRSSLVMYAIQFGLVELDIDETGKSLRTQK